MRTTSRAESRRVAPTQLKCVECEEDFEGRKGRLVCSRRCKDRCYARLHPQKAREKARLASAASASASAARRSISAANGRVSDGVPSDLAASEF
jgi:hypothetical protein